jgi:metal-responsive CopG/Arc/MetJ family transcriptional regulator
MSASFPREIANKIDMERGDVSRSRYFLRIVQSYYQNQNQTTKSKEAIAAGASAITK